MGYVRTNIEIDTAKLNQAKNISGLKSTKATVDFALARLSQTARGLSSLRRLAGKVSFRKGYSYKKDRG